MAAAACVGVEGRQLVMFEVGRREVTVAFDGGEVVTMNCARAKAALYDEPCQLFQDLRDYQAGSWDRPRRVIAKCEVTRQGRPHRRFVVTNLTDPAAHVYRRVYVKRGDAERAIEEFQHGPAIDRFSSHRFFANAFARQCHLLAKALFILFREANATILAVADHTLETIRSRVFKIGAVAGRARERSGSTPRPPGPDMPCSSKSAPP